MKQRVFSLMTALALCLSLCPTWTLAAEGGDNDSYDIHNANAAYTVGPDTQLTTFQMTRAAADTINMDWLEYGCIFAEGIPIVIRQNGNLTSIYHAETGALLSDSTDVSTCTIYGGWLNPSIGVGEQSGDTSIVVESGTVAYLYGGSNYGIVHGNTSITVKNGASVTFLCGGGYNSTLNGSTSITVSGTVGTLYGGTYYDGGEYSFNGNTRVVVNDGASVSFLCGGGYSSTVDGNTNVTVNGGTVGVIYGGGYYDAMNGDTHVTLNGGTVGWVYGGNQEGTVYGTSRVTVNPGAKIWGDDLSSSTSKGAVFGGGYYGSEWGSAANSEVIFNGGDAGWIYGGSVKGGKSIFDDPPPNTRVVINGPADDFIQVCAGGQGSTIGTAELEIQGNTSALNGQAMALSGSGWGDTIEQVHIIIGSGSDTGGSEVFARSPADGTSTVQSASFDVYLAQNGQVHFPVIPGLDGQNVAGKVSACFHGNGDISQTYAPILKGVKEITIDSCRVSLNGNNEQPFQLDLDRLEVTGPGAVVFSNLQSATIGELACNGAVFFERTSSDTDLAAVEVNRITASTPIRIEHTGAHIRDVWENLILFRGPGVEELENASLFVSGDSTYIPAKTEDGTGIHMIKADSREQAYLIPPVFDKPSYRYGDTMEITVGLVAGEDSVRRPIPGVQVEILSGPAYPYQVVGSATLDEEGKAVIYVPVNDALWAAKEHGLQAMFWGNDAYKGNFYGVSLDGSDGEMSFAIEGAAIELEGEIATPVMGETPSAAFTTGEDDFYTAEVIWNPADFVFRYDTEYTASIRLIPKDGYSLVPEKIAGITYQGKALAVPVSTEQDGSLILPDVVTFAAVPRIRVALNTHPAGSGTVKGGGLYKAGDEVTIVAAPYDGDGYGFNYWMENGEIVSYDLEHTITVTEDRDLTAHFHLHDWGPWESDGGEQHSRVCTIWGEKESEAHKWSAWMSDDDAQHSRTCAVCGAKESGAHKYDGDTDVSCNICGYERTLPSEEEPAQVETKIEQSELTEVPEGLEGTAFNTVEKIKAELSRVLIAQAGYSSGNAAFYDVALMVSKDGGKTWVPATEENFPENGLTLTLPYPEGTAQKTHDFVVTHMFTTGYFGNTPGATEEPPVTKTEAGLQFTVRGLSPIAVAWKAIEETPTPTPPPTPMPTPAPSGGGWSGVSTYPITVKQSEHGSVTASCTSAASGSTVTLTVTPEEGYLLDALTVTQSQGHEIKLTDLGGGRYSFTMPSRAVIVAATFVPLSDGVPQQACDGGVECPSRGFTDLGGVGTWYHGAVDYVLKSGLMNGIDSGMFGPENLLTRAQLVQILYNKEGRPAATSRSVFTDVTPSHWYTPAVTWAAAHGLTEGYGSGLFGPDDHITREQLAAVFWRYAGNPAATDKELHFTDADMASNWALDALRWAAENGVLNGRDNGLLDPKGYATRAEAAQILQNYFER